MYILASVIEGSHICLPKILILVYFGRTRKGVFGYILWPFSIDKAIIYILWHLVHFVVIRHIFQAFEKSGNPAIAIKVPFRFKASYVCSY
jgi:hypothetical protein